MNEEQMTMLEVGIVPHHRPDITTLKYEGIYHSISINKKLLEVVAFCKDERNLNRVLSDLPEKIENFLELEFIGSSTDATGVSKVKWRNKDTSKVKGTLTFFVSPALNGKGTNIIGNGMFDDYTMKNEGPSDLINIFLKRIKSLAETGQLATIKGQPNGKDEDEINKSQPLIH